MPNRTTDIINKFKIVHGARYDYSHTIYVRSADKIKIICPEHGIFEMRASAHMQGQGCRRGRCNPSHNRKTQDEVIQQFKIRHGDKFDYSKVIYTNGKAKVEIICSDHGSFFMTPDAHIRGQSCKHGSCNSRYDTKDGWISKAIAVHGSKYDYSFVEYRSSSDKVIIICDRHGPFSVRAQQHLLHGCRGCAYGKVSKSSLAWLKDELNLTDSQIEVPIQCSGKTFFVDGYDATNNTVYEFYGKYWHADPKIYGPSADIRGTLAKDIWARDSQKVEILEAHGYNVIVRWED